jgi:hypothetical protein
MSTMTEPEYLPSPEQIKKACEEIQEGWDDYTRLKRQYNITQETVGELLWTPPMVSYSLATECGFVEDDLDILDIG